MDSERRRQRVRDVRHRLAHDGSPWTRDHVDDFETVTVPERDCDALRDLPDPPSEPAFERFQPF